MKGRFKPMRVEVTLALGDSNLTLNGIMQGKCSECGTTVYRPQTLTRLETLYLEGKSNPSEAKL